MFPYSNSPNLQALFLNPSVKFYSVGMDLGILLKNGLMNGHTGQLTDGGKIT